MRSVNPSPPPAQLEHARVSKTEAPFSESTESPHRGTFGRYRRKFLATGGSMSAAARSPSPGALRFSPTK